MVIAKTASRNVAFKVARMRESIMEDQDEFIMRKSDGEEIGLEASDKAALEDIGHNADLYFANHQSRGQYAKLDAPEGPRVLDRQKLHLGQSHLRSDLTPQCSEYLENSCF